MKSGPSSSAGTGASSGARPQASFTASPIRWAAPKVSRSSASAPRACTRRKRSRSKSAPSTPTRSGAAIIANQNPPRAASA
ncbi:hypothetical protein BG61_02605 [Caballeronia glathei]|uniref:Uncharacterized protein n=1 Tax=Caballeronia glathei TaxID=60547 RepID=A0A069PRH9_9BURK|nr:hypothetical protein BG61_02605 [Caballeronia glathei]